MLAVVASISGVLALPADAREPLPDPVVDVQPMVIGGRDITNPGYVAALLSSSVADPFQAQFCGGSLITANVVVTAAHCVESIAPSDFGVAVGHTALSAITPADRLGVAEVLTYPGWVPGNVDGVDIALVRLASDVANVVPIPIETDSVEPSLGRAMVILGWGAVDPSRTFFADVLKSAVVPALSSVDTAPGVMATTCLSTTPGDDVCFGGVTTAGCNGDSGGPLLAASDPSGTEFELEALVSFGPADQCLSTLAFDAGQRLSPYRAWIAEHVAAWGTPLAVLPPAAPGGLTVVRGNGMADISWTAPTDDGGDPNLTYTVTGSPGGSCIASTNSCHIEPLTNGVSHKFSVAATNSAGTGPASGEVVAVFAAVLIDCDAQTHPFVDLPPGSFANADIGCIASLDITHGTTLTTYGPTEFVTRVQMAAFLARLYRSITGLACVGGPLSFSDVSDGDFGAGDIGCIASLDITHGTTLTTYGPTDLVTREQMAAFLARLYRSITT